jgi:O-antigen ligase
MRCHGMNIAAIRMCPLAPSSVRGNGARAAVGQHGPWVGERRYAGTGGTIVRGQRRMEYGLMALLFVAIVGCGSPWGAGDVLLAIGSILLLGVLFAGQASPGAVHWGRGEWSLLGAFAFIALTQLVPLPPGGWGNLAGREVVLRDLAAAGAVGVWRPMGLDPEGAFRGVAALLPGLAILLGARELSDGGMVRLAHWVVMLASVSALLGMAQVAGGPDSALRLHDFHNWEGAIGFFANRNHQAALLYMSLPIALVLASHRISGNAPSGQPDVRRFLVILALPVILLGWAMTISRAGIGLGLVAMIGGMMVVLSSRQSTNRIRVVLLLVVAIGLLLALLQAAPELSRRLQQDLLDDSRWWLFASTWELRSQYGWWGSGLGSFEVVFRQLPENQLVVGAYVNHAHNDWLELWLELGWVFPIAALAAISAFVVLCWGAWRNPANNLIAPVGRAAALAMGLVAIHSLVDWPLRTGANLTVFSMLAAILLRCGQPSTARGRHPSRTGRPGVARPTSANDEDPD